MAGRCRGLYAATCGPDVDPELACAHAARGGREGGEELRSAQAQLLGDDRRVGLDDQAEALDADDPAGARRRPGTRSATRASNVAIARDRRSSSSSPRARAASGISSPRRTIGRRRVVIARRSPTTTGPARRPRGRPPPASLTTSQAVAMARSSGSRSSSVVVVMNDCGSAAIRRTRCDRRSGSSSEKTSSSRSRGARPSIAVRTSSSASLSARIAVRCWPREAKLARSRPASSKTRSSRCGPISVDPFQTSFSAVSTRRRASASRGDSPGSGGAFVA